LFFFFLFFQEEKDERKERREEGERGFIVGWTVPPGERFFSSRCCHTTLGALHKWCLASPPPRVINFGPHNVGPPWANNFPNWGGTPPVSAPDWVLPIEAPCRSIQYTSKLYGPSVEFTRGNFGQQDPCQMNLTRVLPGQRNNQGNMDPGLTRAKTKPTNPRPQMMQHYPIQQSWTIPAQSRSSEYHLPPVGGTVFTMAFRI